jgi:hypothetical protein
MSKAPAWQKRLLALVAVQSLPAKQQLEITTPLAEGDRNDVVRSYAEAVKQLAALPTSRPSSEPATQGAGDK